MGTDSVSSDALLLLLETVNKQASQIKRLEAVVSGGDTFSCDTGTQKHHGSDRGNKQLLLQLQASVQALEQQHAASSGSNRSMADQLHKVEQRVQQLEAQGSVLQQQLGTPAPTHRAAGAHGQHRLTSGPITSIMQAGAASTAADDVAAVHVVQHAGLPGGRSMAARLSKLEQQVEALTATAASTEERLLSASSAVHTLDEEVGKQLHNIRSDVKAAITVATKSVRADLEAAVHTKRQEDTAQLKEQLRSLTSELDSLVASSQRTLFVNLTADMERRAAATQEASSAATASLRAQLDRLEEEKADITLVTQYTGQVADVFEQLATTVADSTQASIAQLMTQQQELRNLVTSLSAGKADGSSLLQHQQHCQQQLLELQRGLAAAQAAASEAAIAAAVAKTALEPVDALRLQLAETQGTLAALQAAAAGLEAVTSSSQSEQQQQAQSLQQLASSQHMLQQQLMALTNHVDPAAAAQLAAAAAGDESALTFQPLGPLASGSGSLLAQSLFDSLNGGTGWDEAWATGSYLQCSQAGGRSGPGERTGAAGPAQHAGNSAQASAAGSGAAVPHAEEQLPPGAPEGAAGAGSAAAGSSGNGGSTPGSRAAAAGWGFVDRMSTVLRHLPVAVRLLRLETAVRDLHSSMAQKAPAGEVQGLQQQLDAFSERLVDGLTQLEGVSSSSMQHLQEQSATLADAVAALGDSLDERPTHAQVAEKHEALQQQLGGLTAELDAVKARLRGAGQDIQHLKDWQAQASQQVEALQGAEQGVQQVREQLTADLRRQQQEVQQLLAQHSTDVARDTIQQFKADQEVAQGGAETAARVVSLESKLKVVVAEVDRIQEQASLTARLQDKTSDMMAALEAALSAQSSKYATVSQQLRLELKEAVAKASQAQSAKAAALEASLREQSDTLAELAAAVSELPTKGALLDAALKGAKTTVEDLLAKHRKQEEGRWEVWLAEFAHAIEQRPTAAQLQRQLQAVQQAAESNAQEAASQRIQCVTTAVEAHLRQQLGAVQRQLGALCDRTQTLEQGTGIGEGYADGVDAVAAGPDSPSRTQLLSRRAKQGPGFGCPEPAAATGTLAAGAAHAERLQAAAAELAAQQEAARAEAEAEAHRVSVAALVAAFEGSPAPPSVRMAARAPGSAGASPADARSCYAAADPPPVAQWRELPVASSVLAEATGTRAAAAAASPCADSSVAARQEGDSSSDPTVEGSSVYSSCEGDSSMHAAAASLALLHSPQRTAVLPGGPAAAQAQPPSSAESCGSALGGSGVAPRSLMSELQQAACTDTTAQGSGVDDAADATSPSVRSVSPAVLHGLTPISKPHRPEAEDLHRPARMQHALFVAPAAAAGPVSPSSSTPARAADPGQQAPPMQQQQQAASVTEATDCTSELQQLLDLQQQVQQCLLDSGCVAVGRRAKPPKDRQHKKGHKRTRIHSKDSSGAGAAGTEQAATAAAAQPAAAATAAASSTGVMTVDAAIAAAAAAMADRPRPQSSTATGQQQQQHTAAAASSGAASRLQHVQQQQQHALAVSPSEVAAAAPLPAPAQPAGRPSRSQEIRSLLSLQQQLAQCLKDHGCFLQQQRQQQVPPPEPFMGGSSIAGLPQQQAQAPAVQRYSVQEMELEQLLVLQAQMQRAVNRNQAQ